MDPNEQKQQFSFVYIRAVATVAGYAVSLPEVDDDSVDLYIAARGGGGTTRSPHLHVQAKCSAQAFPDGKDIPFPLGIKNYDELRWTNLQIPRILVVVLVPEEAEDWLTHTEEQLVLRRCGYWLSLRGKPETDNTESVTVHVPRTQALSVQSLRAIMERVGQGEMP